MKSILSMTTLLVLRKKREEREREERDNNGCTKGGYHKNRKLQLQLLIVKPFISIYNEYL